MRDVEGMVAALTAGGGRVWAADGRRPAFAMVVLDRPYPDRPRFHGLDHRRADRIRRLMAPQPAPGEVFSGAALEQVGIACPRMHPDQAVLYRADALEVPA